MHGCAVHFERDCGRIAFGIDLEKVGGSLLRITFLDCAAGRPALGNVAGLIAISPLDQIFSVATHQKIGVMLITACEALSPKEQAIPFTMLWPFHLTKGGQRVKRSF